MNKKVLWPDGRAFAFTIFDDTDLATLENAPVVYQFLDGLGLRTTKSVWPIEGREAPRIGGMTCEDPAYREWVRCLQDRGFEVALHGVTHSTATRADIERGLEAFRQYFGADPACHANHTGALDSIYWGEARLTGAQRMAYRALHGWRDEAWQGHVPTSPGFWGDLCRDRVRYVRNFVFGDANTLKACPVMPYRDPDRPFVNAWFAASEGGSITSFLRTVTDSSLERLEAEGGACIMYAHLANGFSDDGQVDERFARLMRRLASRNGWFVPVGTLLDHLRDSAGGVHTISGPERNRIERAWLRHKIRTRGTS
jgi:hypothetical protein